MKFATLAIAGVPAAAIISDDSQKFCLLQDILPSFKGDLSSFISLQPAPILPPVSQWHSLAGQKILAPIPHPQRNIFCVGKNYHEHAKEFAQSGFDTSAAKGELAPAFPVVFTKATSTIVADGDPVSRFAGITEQLDYEAELAIIIGKPGRGISKKNALSHVWGYTIVNDVTARDLQQKHRQWFIGKSMDSFCPMGPWAVRAEDIGNPADLNVKCWVNDELRQNANTRDLIFDIPTIIETISAGMTLQAGDIIATGTPAGVGIGFNPPKFLEIGDVIKISIDHLGTLTNKIAA